jgi:hypothetical protein
LKFAQQRLASKDRRTVDRIEAGDLQAAAGNRNHAHSHQAQAVRAVFAAPGKDADSGPGYCAGGGHAQCDKRLTNASNPASLH